MSTPPLHERVSRAISQSGYYASSAAAALKVSPEAVLQWMNGTTKTIKAENIFALADLTGFSARWLATGEGPPIEAYRNSTIQHVVKVMEHPPPDEQSKFARMADVFAGPVSKDAAAAAGREPDIHG